MYFAIDQDRCFLAHIDCGIKQGKRTAGGLRVPNQATHDRVKNSIFKGLDDESLRMRWGAKTNLMRRSLVMVCRQLDTEAVEDKSEAWNTIASNVVAEAVNEWLELPRTARKVPKQSTEFVVKHQKSSPRCEVTWSSWDVLEMERNDEWYVRV